MAEDNAGYFIIWVGNGGAYGPLREPSLMVDLEYGNPVLGGFESWDAVKPVERAYELLRYSAVEKQDKIYIVRFDLSNIMLGRDENTIGIPATPELHKVFDEYLPEWERECDRFHKENLAAFQKGMEKAGLKWEQVKALREEDKKNGTHRYKTEFYATVVKHIEEFPKPLLVKVEGIDAILDGIEITPMPKI